MPYTDIHPDETLACDFFLDNRGNVPVRKRENGLLTCSARKMQRYTKSNIWAQYASVRALIPDDQQEFDTDIRIQAIEEMVGWPYRLGGWNVGRGRTFFIFSYLYERPTMLSFVGREWI